MNYLFSTLFLFSLFSSVAISQTANQEVELFDFSESLFPNGADQTRLEWEKDFIEFGKKTQLTPQNYIRHLFKWFELNGESRYLYDYLSTYTYRSARYEYDNFRHAEHDLYYDKPTIQQGYLFHHIARDGDNVKRLWNIFDELVIEIISPYMEPGRLERLYAEILIATWDCIKSKKNYGTKLDKIYSEIDSYGVYGLMYDFGTNLECTSVTTMLQTPRDQNLQYDKTWFYGFWVRRYHEGNADVTYEILTSLVK